MIDAMMDAKAARDCEKRERLVERKARSYSLHPVFLLNQETNSAQAAAWSPIRLSSKGVKDDGPDQPSMKRSSHSKRSHTG